jgi:hypothetical protein
MIDRYPVFSRWMQTKGFVQEHKFSLERRWRMDYAHLGLLICIEIEGGVWTMGGHTRPVGFLKNIEKYNAATLCGWAVLRITPQMVKDGSAFDLVDKALIELNPLHIGG